MNEKTEDANHDQIDEALNGSSPSYELFIHGTSDKSIEGAPDLILRRMLPHQADEPPQNDVVVAPEHVEVHLSNGKTSQKPIESNNGPSRVIDYLTSLVDYIPEEVSRVVDAIIAEEEHEVNSAQTLKELELFGVRNGGPEMFDPSHPMDDEDECAERSELQNQYTVRVEYDKR